MTGRKIKADEYDGIYTFIFSTSTVGWLNRPYYGTGGSGLTYIMWEDTYELPANFVQFANVEDPFYGRLRWTDLVELRNRHPNVTGDDASDPTHATFAPDYNAPSSTTTLTGTWTFTDGNNSLTGSGGAALTELEPGDLIKMSTDADTDWREVHQVTSDDAVTLKQLWSGTTGTDTADATPKKDAWRKVLLYPPPDTARVIWFDYIARPCWMLHNDDVPEMPEQYHILLVQAGLANLYEYKDDPRSQNQRNRVSFNVQRMWSESSPQRNVPRLQPAYKKIV
jgi:hypothetical protein